MLKCIKRNHAPDYTEQCSVLFARKTIGEKEDRQSEGLLPESHLNRSTRSDAQRNLDALLQAAMVVFVTSGVDAPVREIAEKAGVGVGTVYRHFPLRSDLIAAVFRSQIDACAKAASVLANENGPFEALSKWLQRYTDFIAAKRGLAAALHSGNPAYESLPKYFEQQLLPAFQTLLESAAAAGEIRTDVDANDLLNAVASLCMSTRDTRPDFRTKMVTLLADGLRYRPTETTEIQRT